MSELLSLLSYPVSALMKLVHAVIGLILDPGGGAAWVLTIVLLVIVVRLALLLPAWRQQVAARRAAALQPRLADLKRRHGKDRAGYLQAAAELQRREGASAGASLLPLLVQVPVFLGLYHLLAGFTVAGAGGNGVFGAAEVALFAHASVFGVPLSAAIHAPAATLAALAPGLTAWSVAAVVLPVAVIAAAATFVGMWWTRRRQSAAPQPAADDTALGSSMRQLSTVMMWLSPAGIIAGAVLFPIPLALVTYWAINASMSTVQSVVMGRLLDRSSPAAGAA